MPSFNSFRVIALGCFLLLCGSVLADESVWIDVRSPQEFATGHHPDAVNIPHTEIAERIADIAPEQSQPINLYCRSGKRAGIAKAILEGMGYSRVSNLGGYRDVMAQLSEQADDH